MFTCWSRVLSLNTMQAMTTNCDPMTCSHADHACYLDDIYIYPFPYLSFHLVIYHTIWVCSHRNKTRFLKEAFTRGLILCEACWNLRKIKISNAFACSSCWVIKAGEGTGHNEHVSNWDIDHSSMVDATNTPFRSASFILSNRSQISSKGRENKDMAHENTRISLSDQTNYVQIF